MEPSRRIEQLIAIMAALRTPGSGCPWDLEQDFSTIAPYTLEEAYEVADAIARGDLADLREELGDLLLQVVFHARMAEEQQAFDFGDVVMAITEKLLRRHPHVFGDAKGATPEAVKGIWSRIKAEEKAARAAERAARGGEAGSAGDADQPGALVGVPVNMPALTRALKLQEKAGKVGFDWNDARAVLAKIREEAGEIVEAIDNGDRAAAADEVGDLLFAVVNLARHLGVDPEGALRGTNQKFTRRFASIERALAARGKSPGEASLAEMDALWDEAKAAEKAAASEGSRTVPEAFQGVAAYFETAGFHVSFRQWAMGETLVIGDGRFSHGGIIAYRRAVHVGRRPDGAWYTDLGGADAGDEFTADQVKAYVVRFLRAADDELEAECQRRVKAVAPNARV